MASIGQELKRERELRGIPLQEIADTTKINIRFLRALEEDQLDMLPERFFTRGIIRTYAQYLGLDEENVLNLYLESLQIQQAQKEEEGDQEVTLHSPPKEKKKIWIFFWIFIIILALFIAITFILKGKETLSSKSEVQTAEQKIQEVPNQDIQLESLANPSDLQEYSEKIKDALDLEIRVEQNTWMEIYADQELQFSGIKPPGTSLQFRALKEFIIHLGNAGGITYTINGRKGKKLGESGSVKKDILITLDNYQDFFNEEEQF